MEEKEAGEKEEEKEKKRKKLQELYMRTQMAKWLHLMRMGK